MGLLAFLVFALGAVLMFSEDKKVDRIEWKADRDRFDKPKYWKEDRLDYCEKCGHYHVKPKCK